MKWRSLSPYEFRKIRASTIFLNLYGLAELLRYIHIITSSALLFHVKTDTLGEVRKAIKMAQAYPYRYKGELRTKQDKCKAAMPLDKARIWLDFNEFCAVGENGEPIYLFSQGDIVNDSAGNDVELYDGMTVCVFDDDFDILSRPDAILAEGIVIRNFLEQYPKVKWLIKLMKNNKSGAEYVYRMSDL